MKPQSQKLRIFDTIAEMQQALRLPGPQHPLISLLDYSKVEISAEVLQDAFVMNFYHITYNAQAGCRNRYGQTTYDFNEGGMIFTLPGQPLTNIQTPASTAGFTLLFHPDFLRNYPLDSRIKKLWLLLVFRKRIAAFV